MHAPRLPAALSINKLHVNVHLGEHAPERSTPQAVEVSMKIYFKDLPSACGNDEGKFLCYGKLTDAMVRLAAAQEYRLIEFLAMRVYEELRAQITACFGEQDAQEIYVWVRLHKCNPPLPQLLGGASFDYTDVPSGLL